MRYRHILSTLFVSLLVFLSGCIKETKKPEEIYLKATDVIPPPYALGSDYSCEETFTVPIENASALAKKWTSLFKTVGIAIYECKDQYHAKEILQEVLEETEDSEMKQMIYKGKEILYSEKEGNYEIFLTHYNLFIVIQGVSYGKDVKNDTFLLLEWILHKLGIVSGEPAIPEGESFPKEEIQVILDIPKTVYHVGEEFEKGRVRVINYNLSREVIFVLWYEIGGKLARTAGGITGGTDKPGEPGYPAIYSVFAPHCELTHNPYTGGYDKFWKPGNFTIVVSCYDCEDIKRITGKQYGKDTIWIDDLQDVPPIKVVRKKIVILEK